MKNKISNSSATQLTKMEYSMEKKFEYTYLGIINGNLLVENDITGEKIYLNHVLFSKNTILLLKTGMKVNVGHDDVKVVSVTPVDKFVFHSVFNIKTNSDQEKVAVLPSGLQVVIPSYHSNDVHKGSKIPVNILDGTYYDGDKQKADDLSRDKGVIR